MLPEKRTGFIVMINGDADDARTVLTQVLVKHFTAPQSRPSVADYAGRLAAEQHASATARPVPDTSRRTLASNADLRGKTGVYSDPWFGEVALCAGKDGPRFTSAKSPRMTGRVMRSGKRLLVQWDGFDADVEPWLDIVPATQDAAGSMTMTKIDPDADFSSDYEDLAFKRVRDCP